MRQTCVLFFSVMFFCLLYCELPQDPSTIPANSRVELAIDSLAAKADTEGVFHLTVDDSIPFHVHRQLGNLIDSFIVEFGDDSSICFPTNKFKNDTFDISFRFTSSGRKSINLIIYRTDGSVQTREGVIIIDIANRVPGFLAGKPHSNYAINDGDSTAIPISAIDTKGERLVFFIGEKKLPAGATAEIVYDTSLVVFMPANSSGSYSLTIKVTDSKDTAAATVALTVNDRTPPKPPVFKSPSIVNTTTPTWDWKSGGGGCGVYRYVLDNNDFSGNKSTETDTTSFTSPTSLTEGVHTLFIQERDSSGNWSKTASWAIIIDRTAPAAPLVTGLTPTNNPTPTWTWTGSDSKEPVFRIKLDSPKFTPADTSETKATSFTPGSKLSEGGHTLYVQEKDEAGNWSASGSFTIVIDLTGPAAPTVTGTTPTSNRRPVWTWISNGGGKGYFRCALDSNVFSGSGFFTSALTYIASTDLSEGDHTLYVQEQDSVGNWSPSGSFTIKIDITPPGAPAFTSPITVSNKLRPEWRWTSGGGGSGKYRYRLDNDDLAAVSPLEATSYTPPTNLTEGPHTLFLQEVDASGNWSIIVFQVIVIDTTPPGAPVVSGSALTNNPRPTWTWTSAAGGSGNYRLKIDSDNLESESILSNATAYTPDADLAEGIHRFYIQERDSAGNWSKIESFVTTIDLTPPGKPIVVGASRTNSRRPVWSWGSGGNGIGEYRYKLNSDNLSEGAVNTNFTNFVPAEDLADGEYTLYVQEKDAAGNWSAAGYSTTIIDATAAGAPVVSAVSPTNNPAPTWSWTSGGGAGTYRYKLDSQDFSTGATETTGLSFTPASALTEGFHVLFIQENDGAGNWSAMGICVVQIDLTPPSPPSIAGATPTNDLTPTWSWESVDGAGVFRYKIDSNDLSSGATITDKTSFTPEGNLSTGQHTLYLQERDAAGNWSIIVSLSIVIDTTPPCAPVVAGTTSPTNNRRPLWTWTTCGGGNGTFRYKLDDGSFSGGTTSLKFQPGADLSEGAHTLYVQERDDAGNWSASGEKTIVVDITPPGTPKVSGAALTNNPTPTWTWTSGGGGNGTFRYKLNESDLSTGATQTTSTSYTPSAPLSEASHTLYVQERDAAGNWSSTGSFAITIDITKPGKPTFLSETTTSPSGSKTITWVWQSGGNGGNGKYRLTLGSTWIADTALTSYTATLAEGRHTLSIAERDDAGNWSDTASLSIYILPAPSNLKVTSVSIDTGWGEKLTWDDNSSSENKFYIYRKGILCFVIKGIITCMPFNYLIDSVNANVKTYVDFNVTSCDTFTYYVAAVRTNEGMTYSETVSHKAIKPGTLCLIPIDPVIREPIILPKPAETVIEPGE